MSRIIAWSDILRVLEKLGYRMEKNPRGAQRNFTHPNRVPDYVSFHEPHGGQVIYRVRVAKRLRISMETLAELSK